jgi:hypothetical protein
MPRRSEDSNHPNTDDEITSRTTKPARAQRSAHDVRASGPAESQVSVWAFAHAVPISRAACAAKSGLIERDARKRRDGETCDERIDDGEAEGSRAAGRRSGAQGTTRRNVAIEWTFPELGLPASRRALRRSVEDATSRTRRMSAVARRAVSQRMKKYWAERRKAKARIK